MVGGDGIRSTTKPNREVRPDAAGHVLDEPREVGTVHRRVLETTVGAEAVGVVAAPADPHQRTMLAAVRE
jgi:hypothetical protein